MAVITPASASPHAPPSPHTTLMRKAKELEAAFLSEMLGHAGLSPQDSPFGGGAGEAQFNSFLRQEQARMMVAKGGIGLAEVLFRAMEPQVRGAGDAA